MKKYDAVLEKEFSLPENKGKIDSIFNEIVKLVEIAK